LAAETLAAETLAPETPASETLAPETPASGFRGAARMVFATPALLLPMLFGWLTAFYNAPEGVAAPLATSLGGGAVMVGVILAAEVLGEVVGMTIFGRLVPPGARNRWMGPMSVGACAVLALFALPPSLAVALPVLFVSGLCGSYQIAASAAFVSALPRHVRGTAFGLAQGGMSLGQGVVMTAAGAAAGAFAPAWVITVIGIIGACCALIVAVSWARTGGKEPRRRPA
jgi:MFS family permease